MNVRVDIGTLQKACELVSAGDSAGVNAEAFVNRRDGRVVVRGEGRAYRRLKDLLDEAGRLDQWHAHELAATEQALAQWCVENGFEPSRPAAD